MKVNFTRTMLASIVLASAVSLSAQDAKKILSFTVAQDAAGKSMSFEMSATGGQSIQVDWGNGTLSSAIVLGDYDTNWTNTKISGTIAGGTITVYGISPETITNVDLSWDKNSGEETKIKTLDVSALTNVKVIEVPTNALTALDLSNCSNITTLKAGNNALEKLTLPSSAEALVTIDVSNTFDINTGTNTTGSNEVLGSNWAAAPNLQTLNVNGNSKLRMISWFQFEEFDISKNLNIKTLNINGSKLSSIDLTNHTKLATLNAQWNQFTTLDLSKMASKAIVFANNNNLESIKVPANMTRLQIKNNAFTFATLPINPTATATNYVFAPQAALNTSISGDNIVDLSSQAKVGEIESVFVWKSGDNTINDYTMTDGKFTFTKDIQDVFCEITNSAFPGLTLTTDKLTSPNLMPLIMSFDVKLVENIPATFTLATADGGSSNVYIDWGDGVKDGPHMVTDDTWGPISSAPKGKTIKIYGDPEAITYFYSTAGYSFVTEKFENLQIESINLSALTKLSTLVLNQGLISALDLSKNKELKRIELQSNKITSFDYDLPKLEDLDLSNNAMNNARAFGENKPVIDLTKYPALTEFVANYTGISVDFTKVGTVETIRLIGNDIESVDLSKPTTATTISLNYNKLTSIDASGISKTASLYLPGNKLTSIKIPEGMTGTLNVSNNCFTFATLPAAWNSLTYSPQAAMEVAVVDGKVDLSSQAMVGTTATAFAWKDGETDLVEGTDYTVANGVFTFLKDSEKAVCTMTNADFSSLTLKTAELNIKSAGIESIDADNDAPVEYYDLRGIRVNGDAPGLYIRRQGNKTTKVLVK